MSNYKDFGMSDGMANYLKTMSKLTEAVQGIYSNPAYMSAAESAQRMSEALGGICYNKAFMKSIEISQNISKAVGQAFPKSYFLPQNFEAITRLTESLTQSPLINLVQNDKLYSALQKSIEPQMLAMKNADFVKLADRISLGTNNISSMIENIQNAMNVMASMGEQYIPDEDNLEENDYSSDIDDIVAGELTDDEIENRNRESGGRLLICLRKIIFWFILTFVGGYIQYLSEPIYETLDNLIIKEEADSQSNEVGSVNVGKLVSILGDKDGYAELSYEDENCTMQGYISFTDLESKTQLIRDAFDDEQILFASNCMLQMASYWNIDLDETNERLNKKFDIVTGFIIPRYEQLCELSDEELSEMIDKEYRRRVKAKDSEVVNKND